MKGNFDGWRSSKASTSRGKEIGVRFPFRTIPQPEYKRLHYIGTVKLPRNNFLKYMRIVTKSTAIKLGAAAIASIAIFQAVISFGCHQESLYNYLMTMIFVAVPMMPALFTLKSRNPLYAVGASIFFAPWLIYVYYSSCVNPEASGGASMIYIAVLLWGLPTTLIGIVISSYVLNSLKITVSET
jgi:hypothetical protein